MLRRTLGSTLLSTSAAGLLLLGGATASSAQTPPAVTVTTLAERTVTPAQLAAGSLVWRLETLPTGDAAVAATGSTGVAATFGGRNYLVTLAPAGSRTPGATLVAETGAVPVPRTASQIALRISSLTAPAAGQSAVHAHPGAEGYYVLSGEFGARSQAGTVRVPAGRSFVGPAAGTPVQAVNTGPADLQALVFFALDAAQPASAAADFADPTAAARLTPGAIGLPATGAPAPLHTFFGAGTLMLAGLGFLATRRRLSAPPTASQPNR